MRLAVVGSRNFEFTATAAAPGGPMTIHGVLATWIDLDPDLHIVSGGCQGPDALAIGFAKLWHLGYTVFPANWDVYGKAAGPVRNSRIVAFADAVVAFHDGTSRGTADTIAKAKKAGKAVQIYYPDGRCEETPLADLKAQWRADKEMQAAS